MQFATFQRLCQAWFYRHFDFADEEKFWLSEAFQIRLESKLHQVDVQIHLALQHFIEIVERLKSWRFSVPTQTEVQQCQYQFPIRLLN